MKQPSVLRRRAGLAALLTAGALMAASAPASALAAHHLRALPQPRATASISPVTPCSSLTGRSFTGVPGAPGKVTSARLVTETPSGAAVTFCKVGGVMAPHTTFGLLLPASTWQGQYVQEGCGLLCGAVPLSVYPETALTCPEILDGDVALAADDMGHTSGPADGQWALHSLRLRIIFGLTSEDSLDHLDRAIITAYYGRPPAYSYYDGCSTGGREALMLAQRYPDDFDGIIAGSPAMNLAPLSLLNAWLVRSNTAPDGHQILTAEDIPALHAAVIRACADTGGLIADPRKCAFDPASIQCPPGTQSSSCLTPAQVTAVRKFYRSPTDPQGQSLYNGGEPYGSELGWAGEFIMPAADQGAPADSPVAQVALNYLKYMAFWPNPPQNFTLADVPFTAQEFRKVNRLGDLLYNANDPDLRAFAGHGGKLIMYHGWADQEIPPWSTLDYYAAVERTTGGYPASQSFSRLYLIPGAYHCLFAPDSSTVNLADFMSALIAWVQDGTPPGGVPADTWSLTQNKIIQYQTAQPYNALAPVTAAQGSLNGHYNYIGHY